ncbi:hypothetical protein BCR33DRAFT_797694 [Rhizoclosmatium globosum]|uniref:Uncharacterized protein n=1 Tax=Rhizoclosmatium globosum TaxID=329046 RepID=A0A1Y2AI55_9FUNG|nr:hypothetical protein BCR33DRAFT_797694 [Rhizoclosmatium globosum]|eukprot:ORY21635.1 hypothetical protein BCR33DRAFT_797694 [Rhizoclosmatium globosum]
MVLKLQSYVISDVVVICNHTISLNALSCSSRSITNLEEFESDEEVPLVSKRAKLSGQVGSTTVDTPAANQSVGPFESEQANPSIQTESEHALISTKMAQRYPQMVKLIALIQVLTVSTAAVEHSFSKMKLIKS